MTKQYWLLLISVCALSLAAVLVVRGKTSERTSVSSEVVTQSASVSDNTILPSPTPAPPKPITFVFLGDMMFDRHIRVNAQKRGGYDVLLSQGLKDMFASADLVVGNLEGPVTTSTSKSVGSIVGSSANFIFTFDPTVVPFLYKHNIRLVNLGNNHILNFGTTGLEETYELLEQGAVEYFGATGSPSEQNRTHSLTMGETSFSFVNYNQFTPAGYDSALEDLASVRETHDVVILYTHWGNEYVPENAVLKEQARAFVAEGADLIIGSHPHVVTGTEVIDGKTVYYSLGNFIFDQYFEPAVREGLVVSAAYDPATNTFSFTDTPVRLDQNGTTSLATE